MSSKDDDESPFDILGQALQASPAFKSLLAKRIATGRPNFGASVLPGADDAMENLAPAADETENVDELLSKAPKFSEYADKPAPSIERGPVVHKVPLRKALDHSIAFGPQKGFAGQTINIQAMPRCLFRGERILATDDAVPAGSGTRIQNVLVGNKQQTHSSVLTSFFSQQSLGSGTKFDTCDPALAITMSVQYMKTCTFSATLFGKAVF